MDEGNEYQDPIISVFKLESNTIDTAAIRSLIDKQSDAGNEVDIKYSETSLNIYTEFLRIEYFIEKTWDIKTLETSVLVKFESYDKQGDETKCMVDDSNDASFYKDIALKCIRNCDKISSRLSHYQDQIAVVRSYINEMQFRILEDSVTLLLEIWFTCNKKLKFLRNKIAGIFLRSKLLIIDHELESFRAHLSDPKVIPSYRSFIKILIEQLQDAEVSKDQSLFDDCLAIFLDIESMFNSLHLNMLKSQNKSLQDAILTDSTNFDEMNTYSSGTLNNHSRTSSMSTSLDLSCLNEKTSLTKELPNLLAAFNNAKKLEQELENARAIPHTPIPSSSSPSLLHSVLHSNQPVICSNEAFRSKLNLLNQQQNMVSHFPISPSYGRSPTMGNNSILQNLYGGSGRSSDANMQ